MELQYLVDEASSEESALVVVALLCVEGFRVRLV